MPRTLSALVWLLAAVALAGQLAYVAGYDTVGVDFLPLRAAGEAVLHGQSVYGDARFVYPPSAALFFTLLTIGTARFAYWVWTFACVVALVAGSVLLGRRVGGQNWVLVAGLISFGMFASQVVNDCLFLGNVTPLLVPCVVLLVTYFGSRRLLAGCIVLGISVLVKPLLLPLALLPLMARQWRPVAVVGGLTATIELLAAVLMPGTSDLAKVLRHLSRGSELHGINGQFNLSLYGLGEVRGISSFMMICRALTLIAAIVVVVITAIARREWQLQIAALSGLILTTLFLVGPLAEVHYLLLLMPLAVMTVADCAGGLGRIVTAIGLAMCIVPRAYLFGLVRPGPSLQLWYVLTEVVLAAGFTAALLMDRSRRIVAAV